MNLDTWLVSGGRTRAPGMPLSVPPVPVSAFVHGDGPEYARDDSTPTWDALEQILGGLEGGLAVSFASGMAAVSAVLDQLPSGSTIAIPGDCYQGVVELAEAGEARGRWTVQRVEIEDTEGWIQACSYADLIWLESISNPLLAVADIAAICSRPRRPGSLLSVDNTIATPLNLRPLDLGADLCVQSATKLIGGHSDLLAGVATTKDAAIWAALKRSRELAGATPGSLEAFLAARGARTLALRLERAQATAMLLATRLESHPQVTTTRYPGLSSHPTHLAARRNLRGCGTVISFDLRGGADAAGDCCGRLELIRHATSFGAVESTIERRAGVRGQEHLPPGLLRLSVGIEDPEDLWNDLERALDRAGR